MNDGDYYRVSWLGQGEAAVFVQSARDQIQSELDLINTQSQALIGAWEDTQSKGEYQTRQDTWTRAANDIIMALDKFKTSLNTSADISSSTERAAAITMSGQA